MDIIISSTACIKCLYGCGAGADACSFDSKSSKFKRSCKGVCVNTNNGASYKCQCGAGFTGPSCDERIAKPPSTTSQP
jgi:hypothetical protein